MKKSIFLLALLLLSYSLSYSQDTLWTRRYDIPGFIKNAIFSPDDSKILVTGTETFFEVNPQNGEMIREMPELAGRGVRYVEPDKNIGINYSCQLVDLNDYKVIKQIVDTNKYKVPTMFDFVYTNDLRRIAFALKNIIVIDVLSGTEIILEQEFPDFETVLRMDLSPDGRYLALWSYYYELIDEEDLTKNHHYQMIKILDIATNTVLKKFSFPSDQQSRTLKFSPDGSMLAVHTGAGVDMYTVPDLEWIDDFQFIAGSGGIVGYQFSNDSKEIALGSVGHMEIINIVNNQLRFQTKYPAASYRYINFSHNSNQIINSSSSKYIFLFKNIANGLTSADEIEIIFPNPSTGELILKLPIFQIGNLKIFILDSNGKSVFTKDYTMTNDSISIDMSSHPRGVYFVNIESNGNILQTYKFIKE